MHYQPQKPKEGTETLPFSGEGVAASTRGVGRPGQHHHRRGRLFSARSRAAARGSEGASRFREVEESERERWDNREREKKRGSGSPL